jgi:hypothetical protein
MTRRIPFLHVIPGPSRTRGPCPNSGCGQNRYYVTYKDSRERKDAPTLSPERKPASLGSGKPGASSFRRILSQTLRSTWYQSAGCSEGSSRKGQRSTRGCPSRREQILRRCAPQNDRRRRRPLVGHSEPFECAQGRLREESDTVPGVAVLAKRWLISYGLAFDSRLFVFVARKFLRLMRAV